MNYTYLILPIKELKNLLNNDNFKSTRKINKVETIEESQSEIIRIIEKDKLNNEYCILKIKSDFENVLKKEELMHTKKNLNIIYFMMKNENKQMELIPFNYPKNEEYINIILKYK